MRPRFQADENLNAKIIAGLLRREPSMNFLTAKAANLFGLPDPEMLALALGEAPLLWRIDWRRRMENVKDALPEIILGKRHNFIDSKAAPRYSQP